MAVGRRRKAGQAELFVATDRIRAPGNPFCRALDELPEKHGFRRVRGGDVRRFHAERRGRPGVYFRMLMVGYREGYADIIELDRASAEWAAQGAWPEE